MKKIVALVLIFIIISIIMFIVFRIDYKISKDINKKYVYISINNKKYKEYLVSDEGNLDLTIKENDSIKISLHASATITADWNYILSNDKISFIDKKRKPIRIPFHERNKEGNSLDREILEFVAKKQGNCRIKLAYIPMDITLNEENIYEKSYFLINLNIEIQ